MSKTVLHSRNQPAPEGIDPKVSQWMTALNSAHAHDNQDLEDEFNKIGIVKRWTPVLTFATPGDLSVSYTTQIGDLIRTRELVIASFNIVTSAFTWTTASGNLEITGLPYAGSTLAADSGSIWNGSLVYQGITKANYTQFNSQVRAGNNFLLVAASGSAKSAALLQAADMPTGGSVALIGTCAFRVRS